MKRTKRSLGTAVAIFVGMSPVPTLAQASSAARDTAPPLRALGTSAVAGTLPPSEILAQVRRAGFDPVSPPVQLGNTYVLFAFDPYDVDVKLVVDARSGRVLWVTRMGGMRYGGSGYYGYHLFSRTGPPIPPGDIPYAGPTRNNLGLGPGRSNASKRRSPPLPRLRPPDLATGAVKETAPTAQSDKLVAPSRPEVPTPATSRLAPPTMVPIAPLE